jgi:CubicO group peptidase (beta-lactamase class C family)
MNTSRLIKSATEALIDRARKEVDEGLLPSCQFALAIEGEIAEFHTIGKTPAGERTRYMLYSASKAVVSSAVWQLIGEDKIKLSDTVAKHIPEFGANGKERVTIEQLLAHTAGIPRQTLMPPAWDTRAGRLKAFSEWPLEWEAGSSFEYHITSAHWVQAELLERFDGIDYRKSITKRISERLGLPSLRLGVPEAQQGDISRTRLVGQPATSEEFMAALGIPGVDPKEAHDDNLAAMAQPFVLEVGVPGGGAVSTAADFALFWQELYHNKKKAWDEAVLRDATSHIRTKGADWIRGGIAANRTLGLLVAGDDGAAPARGFGHAISPQTFGHDGAGGQTCWFDPATGLSFVYLTDGIDRHLLRQWKRTRSIASRAAVCAEKRAAA